MELPHRGFSVASGRLTDALRERVGGSADDGVGGWVIDARGRGPSAGAPDRVRLGRRQAICADVVLRAAPPERCWMEVTPDGWLFLAPAGHGSGCLQAVVPDQTADAAGDLRRLLAGAAVVPRLVSGFATVPTAFDAFPSIAVPVAEPGAIRVGEAAVAFDPVCGDGTGNALRSAVLAAAVLEAAAEGLPVAEGLAYYRWRLARALAGHARACDAFYQTEFRSRAWSEEVARGAVALARDDSGAPAFRLDGLRLVRAALQEKSSE